VYFLTEVLMPYTVAAFKKKAPAMLIKSADDNSKDIETLHGLLNHPSATPEVKKNIEQEIRAIQAGAKGEKEAAYEIDSHFKSNNWSVIHDLRIKHDGWSAQIDHIIINRWLDIWVCESKHFVEGIAINEHGECSSFLGGKAWGIPSPFEQNRKHCALLKEVFDHGAVELPKRLGFSITPDIKSLVLVSKNARITRPKTTIKGLDSILKADQITARIDKDLDSDNNPLRTAKIVAPATLERFARRLAAVHTPAVFDWHAKFGLSKEPVASGSILPVHSNAAPKATAPEMRAEREKASNHSCLSCGDQRVRQRLQVLLVQ